MKKSIRNFFEKVPLFVFVVPLFFLLHTLNYYFGLVDPLNHITGIFLYLLVPLCLLPVLKIIFSSYAKAATLLLFLMLFFYPFQYLHDSLKRFLPWLSRYSILLPVILLLISFLVFYLLRTKSTFKRFLLAVNTIFALLVLSELSELGYRFATGADKENFVVDPKQDIRNQYISCDTCIKPDIYFLLFDEYTNSKTLKSDFNFENRFLDDHLHSRGFKIIYHSTSNYNITPISIASLLNMNYLSGLHNEKVELRRFLRGVYTINHNAFTPFLKKEGYEINNYSLFDLDQASAKVDPFVLRFRDEFLFGVTFFHKARRDIGWAIKKFFKDSSLSKRTVQLMEGDLQRISETYKGAIHEAKKNKVLPQFTYCHFLNTHGPWYFDSVGNRLPAIHSAMETDNRNDYVNNIIYANKSFIIPIIDSINYNARRPYVIILQGDHGFTQNPGHKEQLVFENLNAWYFSDMQYKSLNDSLTSVNTFRIILNKYFGQKLEMLHDSTIYLRKIGPVNQEKQ